MLNGPWKNPLFVKGATAEQDRMWSRTPEALAELKWSDLPYICKIMTFCGIKAGHGGPVMLPRLEGNVSLYTSRSVLSIGSGLESFLDERKTPAADRERIASAWNFLVDNNQLYRQQQHVQHVEPRLQTGQATFVRDVEDTRRPVHAGQAPFGDFVIRGEDEPGPRAGDIDIGEVAVGVDPVTEELVSFAEKDLMAQVFPELFPLGDGHFSLWHQKVKGRSAAEIHVARGKSWSLRDYCKYRLLHFDRTFARNIRFIVFCFDWLNKMTVNGYRIRTTSSVREGGRATTKADIVTGKWVFYFLMSKF